ncbi:gustatory receptor for sugar taste 43a isoform X2 [Toxorhynchites rutilus septentrionalis]|uniref:gustatory receptor for sugar taste 43a isoform X2 n=1 Tax=Toxorhynchites rutilus septentrionalis TaxID=329112 RepID=UPI00247890C6|nr:gustatory receptor for sugar taste 43a isoform X2 [Toxorhynchites rutilus septentrionalis]
MKSVFHFLNHAVVRNRRHTMEISESTRAVFFVSRVFGLAPYVVKKTSKGQIVDYKRNLFLVIYGLCVVFCLAGLTFKGIFLDINSKKPIRMKTATSKVVTTLDVSVVVSACICGVFCGVYGLPYVRELNQRLNEADDMLSVYVKADKQSKEKRKGLTMLALVGVIITGALALDIWVWYRIAQKVKKENQDSGANVLGYCPFYALYYILMMFHVLFAQSALGISSRFRHLNIALYHVLPESSKIPVIEITSASSINNVSERMDNAKEQKKGLTAISHAGHTSSIMTSNRMIEDLAYIHASLSTAVILVSNTFGVALLAVLGSCLLHLVATSYFLMVELVGDKDAVFSWIQALWLFIHIFRFLLTVEPCHLTNVESRRTMSIVCNLMRTCKDMLAKERLESFWRQLVGNNSVFTACGLCTIDRHIITSYCGAITTYLVILIQFKEADDRPIRTIYRST